ncbi:MAG: SapC family protein, partial [Alphaproteobacteria bacterium]|nr:SapC family protein [Alphaproteobacteria bacterium]
MANQSSNDLPLFYKQPKVLDRVQDANKKLAMPGNFTFAAQANAVPIVIDEFAIAAASYPIVFLQTAEPVPAVVLGVTPQRNLYVGPNGEWLNNAYLPAYVRRYPFILVDDPQSKQMLLCYDETSGMVTEGGDLPLFDNGQPSMVTNNALNLCLALRQQGETTENFVRALRQRGLLNDQSIEIKTPAGDSHVVNGFLTLDEQKFAALPDDVYIQWRKLGWIKLIYAHLQSQV